MKNRKVAAIVVVESKISCYDLIKGGDAVGADLIPTDDTPNAQRSCLAMSRRRTSYKQGRSRNRPPRPCHPNQPKPKRAMKENPALCLLCNQSSRYSTHRFGPSRTLCARHDVSCSFQAVLTAECRGCQGDPEPQAGK
jgi:hypothetical protein